MPGIALITAPLLTIGTAAVSHAAGDEIREIFNQAISSKILSNAGINEKDDEYKTGSAIIEFAAELAAGGALGSLASKVSSKLFNKHFAKVGEVFEADVAVNITQHNHLKTDLRKMMERPCTEDPILSDIMNKIYRPNQNPVGSGSTADALRIVDLL